MVVRFLRFAFAVALLAVIPGGVALSQVCVATATDINFGTLAISALTGAKITGSVYEGCTAGWPTAGNLAACNSIGAGSNSASAAARTMKLGANSISYQLYSDSGYSVLYAFPGADKFNIPYTTAAGGHATTTTYAQILSSSAGLPPGTYTDTYTTATQAIADFNTYNTANPPITCGTNPFYATATMAFSVKVTIAPSCSISTGNLNFGTAGVLSANIDNTATVNVLCTATTGYNIGLSAGNATGATTSSRKMTGTVGTVGYALYRDASRSANWGNNNGSSGNDTVAGTGTGATQPLAVYGRVPPQTTPRQGGYSDTVVVTVYY